MSRASLDHMSDRRILLTAFGSVQGPRSVDRIPDLRERTFEPSGVNDARPVLILRPVHRLGPDPRLEIDQG